jgi:hypothetical protein
VVVIVIDAVSAIFLKKICPECIVTQNSVEEGEVLVISMLGKKVPACRSGLRPSEKELPEWHSGTFHHKNTPGYCYYFVVNYHAVCTLACR